MTRTTPEEVNLELGYSTESEVNGILYPPARKQEYPRPGLRHQERSASTSSTSGRGTGQERCEEALVL